LIGDLNEDAEPLAGGVVDLEAGDLSVGRGGEEHGRENGENFVHGTELWGFGVSSGSGKLVRHLIPQHVPIHIQIHRAQRIRLRQRGSQ
jgi:hypothetical protein